MEVSGQLHAPAALPPRERAPDTHWIGSWEDPRAILDAVVKRKIPSPRRESSPTTPTVEPAVQRYTDWAITALHHFCDGSKCLWRSNDRKQYVWRVISDNYEDSLKLRLYSKLLCVHEDKSSASHSSAPLTLLIIIIIIIIMISITVVSPKPVIFSAQVNRERTQILFRCYHSKESLCSINYKNQRTAFYL
jgi:hypothetical protein